jgi:hypothetical protein
MITGKNPQLLTTPLSFIFFDKKFLFFNIKEIIEMIKVYKTSIKKVFLINIIMYFIVPNLVSKEEPSLVQKMRPKKTFIIFVVINAVVNKRQIWKLNIVFEGTLDKR